MSSLARRLGLIGTSGPRPFDDLNDGQPVEQGAENGEYDGNGGRQVKDAGEGKDAHDERWVTNAEKDESSGCEW